MATTQNETLVVDKVENVGFATMTSTLDEVPATSTQTRPAAVDGGCQGWMVVAASFVVNVLIYGITFTYGIIVPSLVDHFRCGRSLVGGIGSLMIGLSWISGTRVSLCRRTFVVNQMS